MNESIALVVAAPFVAATLAFLVARYAGPLAGWILALMPAACCLFLFGLVPQIANGSTVTSRFEWIPEYGIELAFLADGLSLTFAIAVSGIGALVVLYAASYLKGHPHRGRFLAVLLAFTGAMLGLVFADTLLLLVAFWELTAVTSFLLIGFDYDREAARRGALQALLMTNVGGLSLLVGVILITLMTGHISLSELLAGGSLATHAAYLPMLLCVLLAAFTKSAQWPFHFWLPNAMEAPTPVSAFLHSAAMVQGGVYLLARLSPVLGGTPAWTAILTVIGAITLLWGALGALRQTDMKQMLAQTTIASLGLLVLLIGLGTETAMIAMLLYFAAHALYKAGLFMVVGAIDHETGTRDITVLSGMADRMPVSFIGAALAAGAMIGLPPTLGFFAKEEMYLDLAALDVPGLLLLAALVVGNGLLAAVGALIAIRPFLGPEMRTPKSAHEAPLAMLIGPIALGGAGIVAALAIDWYGPAFVAPAVSTMLQATVENHLAWHLDLSSPAIWLSLLTWALAFLAYRAAATIRTLLRRLQTSWRWTFDSVFDLAIFSVVRFADAVTRLLHHGKLEGYLVTVFAILALALFVPLLSLGGLRGLMPDADLGNWSARLAWPGLHLHEWAVVATALIGLAVLIGATNRLTAILAMGVQGTAVAMFFLLFGAPDLSFTQFMVEILSVVVLALLMSRLRLDESDRRRPEKRLLDGTVAIACGAGVGLLLLTVLEEPFNAALADFFVATSVPLAHGSNIVNVILVDYRGFDTLGEIAVVMGAGIAVLVLLRGRQARPAGDSR
jgi:multicomponent Na+:H+ antiporter subunit A